MESLSIDKPLLPLSNKDGILDESSMSTLSSNIFGNTNGHVIGDEKKTDAAGPGRPRARSQASNSWRPPGTRQEETWKPGELGTNPSPG